MPVNNKKRGRPASSAPQLTHQRIIDAAKRSMEENGKIPSIRSLAATLNVDPMAIYHYFKTKQLLLESVTESLIDEVIVPDQADWRDSLYQLSTSYLTLLNRYPGLLETLLTMTSTTPANVFSQRYYDIVAKHNFDSSAVEHSLHLLVDYLHGFALATQLNQSGRTIDHAMLKGPLNILILGLQSETSSSLASSNR